MWEKIWVGNKHVFDVMLNASPRSLSQDNACFCLSVFTSIGRLLSFDLVIKLVINNLSTNCWFFKIISIDNCLVLNLII
jgi:hypothetical protein